MKYAVLREFKISSEAFLLLPSATLKTDIYVPAGQAADCLEFLAMVFILLG